MKWPLLVVLIVAGCKDDAKKTAQPEQASTVIQLPKAELTAPYRADIATLCDVVRLSGADQKPKNERWPIIAMWLGPQIKTTEGHDFLVAIQPLKGQTKVLALETEAKRAGIAKCELADEWRE